MCCNVPLLFVVVVVVDDDDDDGGGGSGGGCVQIFIVALFVVSYLYMRL